MCGLCVNLDLFGDWLFSCLFEEYVVWADMRCACFWVLDFLLDVISGLLVLNFGCFVFYVCVGCLFWLTFCGLYVDVCGV